MILFVHDACYPHLESPMPHIIPSETVHTSSNMSLIPSQYFPSTFSAISCFVSQAKSSISAGLGVTWPANT